MRKVIYMATIVAMRWNEKIKAFDQHLRAQGKPAKVAIAVFRRVVESFASVTCNARRFRWQTANRFRRRGDRVRWQRFSRRRLCWNINPRSSADWKAVSCTQRR